MSLYPTRHSLPEDARAQMVELLNQQLADTFDLYSQTKQAHWNVKGIHFQQLHELFDSVAGMVLDYVDTLAERATALGGVARGTARMTAHISRLPELPEDLGSGRQTVSLVADRFGALANSTREAIDAADKAGDADTADLFTEVSRELDKALWFLEAHLRD